jgi:ribosomal protein L7/L12
MFDFLFGPSGLKPVDTTHLRRIERKLDLVLRHLGIEYVEPAQGKDMSEQVRALADRGDKIAAIKAHRELTGAGLAEAKRAVESYLAGKPGAGPSRKA